MKVYEAITKVQKELAQRGVGKDSENKFDGYKFRGIDAVYNALSPLLAKHGLCILPRMISRACEERQSAKGGALFYVTVEAEFDFVASEDGSKHTVRTFGEAMDRGDKATNKAMSAAYKYAAFQAFCIPTEGDNDADASSHEVASKPKGTITPTTGVLDGLDGKTRVRVEKLAAHIEAKFIAGDEWAAFEAWETREMDADASTALWSLLGSKTRSTIKNMKQEADKTVTA